MKNKVGVCVTVFISLCILIVACGPQNIRQNIRQGAKLNTVDISSGITFMTFNIRVGAGIKKPRKSPYDLSGSKEILKEITMAINSVDADVIALQEVKGYWQAKFIAETLNLNYVYISHPGGADWWGLAVLSKFRILKTDGEPIYYSEPRYERSGIVCTIDINGTPITLINVHYHLGSYDRQVSETMKLVKNINRPIVLMGDLNMSPYDAVLEPIQEKLTDTFEAVSTPTDGSQVVQMRGTMGGRRIDYIFVDASFFNVIDVGLAPEEYWDTSDHLAYFARLSLKDKK